MFVSKKRRIAKFKKRIASLKDPKHKFGFVMDEFKSGKLHSSAGYKVKNPAQARAIAYNIAYGPRKGFKDKRHTHNTNYQSKKKSTFWGRLKNVFIKRSVKSI